MPKVNIRLGLGAIVAARVSVLHPEQPFKDKYKNSYGSTTVESLKVVSSEWKPSPKGPKLIIHLSHPDFPTTDIWAFAAATRLVTPGPPPYFGATPAAQDLPGEKISARVRMEVDFMLLWMGACGLLV
jgi:hypothetical protein